MCQALCPGHTVVTKEDADHVFMEIAQGFEVVDETIMQIYDYE